MNPIEDRMPPLLDEQMDDVQRAAALELIAGPRKAVKGPFIPLLRSPELMERLQKVGEYLRFASPLSPRIREFATLVIARQWSEQFEWATHVPLALQSGTQQQTIDELAQGARPTQMSADEALVYDFASELIRNHGVSDRTYRNAVESLGEKGLIDLIGIFGYFSLLSMVLNVAHTPPDSPSAVVALRPFPR